MNHAIEFEALCKRYGALTAKLDLSSINSS